MDLILLIGIATALLIVIVTLFFFQRKSTKPAEQQRPVPQPRPVRAGGDAIPRRAQIARNQRNRLRNNATAAALLVDDPDGEDEEQIDDAPHAAHVMPDEKMGAKKRAKLEAKAEKRIHREQQNLAREEKKARDEKLEEERKKLDELEAEQERKQAEAERLAREERERKEYEEYLKMKAAFSVEEEGFEEAEAEEKEQLLAEFIQYIKDSKVVLLEELATHFKLKTQQAIDRITELQSNGNLTGVIDDRGKFIYISEEELKQVAKFIKQRGRVSITDLAECSNSLINLTPVSD